MKSPKNIIKELEKLVQKDRIEVGEFFDPTEEYQYEPIKHYITSLTIPTKPETASHELFRELVKDVLKRETFNEVSIGRNFVDFTLKESIGNPILIELKPLFKLIKSRGFLKAEELNYKEHKEQVLKYLKKNEYVILTNLKETFLFSRNAIIDFEPFSQITFADLLKSFLRYNNLWDTVKRIEDQEIKVDLDKSFFEDLKNWYNEFKDIKIIENNKFSKEELIVLLLNKILLDYQDYRLVYRDVASSTNERTLIASIISPNVFIGNTLNYVIGRDYNLDNGNFSQQQIPKEDIVFLLIMFNSLTLNYYLRNKVSAHASMFFVYELPIANVTIEQKEYLVKTGFTLLSLNSEAKQFNKLKNELGITIDKKADSIKLRAELELFIAKELYGLNDEDWKYITSTFTYGGKTETRKELDQIIDCSLKTNS